jgi:hypothetical protein
MKIAAIAVLLEAAWLAAAPSPWIMATSTNSAILSIAPDVHSVRSDDCFVYIKSAGLSLHSFGALEVNQYDPPRGPRALEFRIPRHPHASTSHPYTPQGIVGVFVTGVPIYNAIGTDSYNNQNIWHRDAVAQSATPPTPLLTSLNTNGTRHSPIIGFALDGYPIYGPFGFDANGNIRRMRSSYRRRRIAKRDILPDGTALTPSQEGPAVDAQYPLGAFAEDYEYVPNSGDLDEFNGRFTTTPDYPDGTYAYFLSEWPYLIGPRYYGDPQWETPRSGKVLHSARVELSTDRTEIHAGEPVRLSLTFRDAKGRPIRFLEKVHERPVHLIAVSSDLSVFDHTHPEPSPDGSLTVAHSFPRAGTYWLYADYNAPGEGPSIARLSLSVTGGPAHRQTNAPPDIHVTMNAPNVIKSGADIPLSFTLANTANGQPVADLEPWLGAWAHIIAIGADGANFIHAHPLDNPTAAEPAQPHTHTPVIAGPSPSVIQTLTGFNAPGRYKLWLQFQREGKVVTVPFDLNVEAASRKPTPPAIPADIHVLVGSAGFEPARLELPAGRATQVSFIRTDAQNCANELVIPALGIRRALPVGQTVLIEIPAQQSGELRYACGMGMHKAVLLLK